MATLKDKIKTKDAVIGICGLGYVGLPLALAAGLKDLKVIGFDINEPRVKMLNDGTSDIGAVSSEALQGLIDKELFLATTDPDKLAECDAILICVPTPLSKNREPDLKFIIETTETIAKTLRDGQLIVLESTTYPGTTSGVMRPILEETGLKSGKDFFLGYSPEREDPGNQSYHTAVIPKVVGGDGETALELSLALYEIFVTEVVPVSSTEAAEAVKLTENIFRAVNIALVNELKVIFSEMDIDVWEVIEAAKTKPFGYMPFYPGPGLGGHCIPIDPFYLTWKAREYGISTRFIELAGEINVAMPRYVVSRTMSEFDLRFKKGLNGAKILILGLAYKKNISDMRESPSLALMELFEKQGSDVSYHDPFVPEIPPTREHAEFTGMKSVALDGLDAFDAVVVATDHDDVDYDFIKDKAGLIIDTRNIYAKLGISSENIAKA